MQGNQYNVLHEQVGNPSQQKPDVANARIVCNVCPQKEETNQTRLTFAGHNLTINMDCGTPTADLLTIELLPNNVISTPGAKFMMPDIKDFYLTTPMEKPEFLRMNINHFPDDVVEQYQLRQKGDPKGYVYVWVEKVM